jgi:hypothetical protein
MALSTGPDACCICVPSPSASLARGSVSTLGAWWLAKYLSLVYLQVAANRVVGSLRLCNGFIGKLRNRP